MNWLEAARRLYQKDGEVEIDTDAEVSLSGLDGAYVQAWVYVPIEEAHEEESYDRP